MNIGEFFNDLRNMATRGPVQARRSGSPMKRTRTGASTPGAFKPSGQGRSRRSYRMIPANMRRR